MEIHNTTRWIYGVHHLLVYKMQVIKGNNLNLISAKKLKAYDSIMDGYQRLLAYLLHIKALKNTRQLGHQ